MSKEWTEWEYRNVSLVRGCRNGILAMRKKKKGGGGMLRVPGARSKGKSSLESGRTWRIPGSLNGCQQPTGEPVVRARHLRSPSPWSVETVSSCVRSRPSLSLGLQVQHRINDLLAIIAFFLGLGEGGGMVLSVVQYLGGRGGGRQKKKKGLHKNQSQRLSSL